MGGPPGVCDQSMAKLALERAPFLSSPRGRKGDLAEGGRPWEPVGVHEKAARKSKEAEAAPKVSYVAGTMGS